MSDFKEEKKILVSKQEKLLVELSDTEKLLLPFQRLSNELYDLVLKCDDAKIKDLSLVWFNAFLGYKDECMVLSKGDLIRKYHIKKYKMYIHSREKERHYYNSNYSLSSLSRDGIDYEYRQLVDKYPNKSLNSIANKSDEIGNRVDALSKALDESFRLQEALKKRHVNVKMILIHNGEQIMAKDAEGTPLFKLLRGDMNTEKITKEMSLTTTLDEDFIKSCQIKTSNNLPITKKRQNVIYDSDEDKKQEENEKKRLRQIEKERKKEETNFQMDVNLEQLKSNRPQEQDTSIIGEGNKTKHANSSTGQGSINIHAPVFKDFLNAVLANLRDSTVHTASTDIEVFGDNNNNDMPKITETRSKVRKNPFNEERVSLEQELHIRVHLSERKHRDIRAVGKWNIDIDSNKPPARSDLFVSCDDVFRYFFKKLLTSDPCCIECPSYLVVNGTKYRKGDTFPLPKDQNLKIDVYCYNSDMATLCLNEIVNILRQISTDNKENNTDGNHPLKYYLDMNFQFIEVVLKAVTAMDSNTNTINFDFDSLSSELTGVSSKCVHALIDAIKGKNSAVNINANANYTKIDAIALASLLRHSTNVSLQCCGIKADLLNDVIKIFNSNNNNTDSNNIVSLTKLNMAYNNFLKTKTTTKWTPLSLNASNDTQSTWADFVCMIFTKCINLEELNISNCADNDDQMNILCEGISLATKLRSELGLNPIFRVTINGVRNSYPEHATFLDNLTSSNFITTLNIDGLNKLSLFTSL